MNAFSTQTEACDSDMLVTVALRCSAGMFVSITRFASPQAEHVNELLSESECTCTGMTALTQTGLGRWMKINLREISSIHA